MSLNTNSWDYGYHKIKIEDVQYKSTATFIHFNLLFA